MHGFSCLFFCLYVQVCAPCMCVFATLVARMAERGLFFFFLSWDAKQQKKRRLSRKVSGSVEEGVRYPSQKPIHFLGHHGYLFLFLWKRRHFLQVSWQPAWGQLDTSSADIWRRTWSPEVNKLTGQISLRSCLLCCRSKFLVAFYSFK